MRQNVERRKKQIQLIHVALSKARICVCGNLFFDICTCGRKEGMKLDREAYEAIIFARTGKTSCSEMNTRELSTILAFFNQCGFNRKPFEIRREIREEKDNIIRSIKERARQALGNNWEARLTGYLRKRMHTDQLSFCTLDQLRQVQGFISNIIRIGREE